MKSNLVFRMVFNKGRLEFIDDNDTRFSLIYLNDNNCFFVQAIEVREKDSQLPVTLAFFEKITK